uniref:Uncharacterized protein n=1 Tax=Romanomermis culicivorax TaxID=13658 RepID=A0A915L568_ROMCU
MSDLDSVLTYVDKSRTTNIPQSSREEGNSAAINAGTICTDDSTFWTYFGMIIIAFIILTFQLCATYISVKCIINMKQVEKVPGGLDNARLLGLLEGVQHLTGDKRTPCAFVLQQLPFADHYYNSLIKHSKKLRNATVR